MMRSPRKARIDLNRFVLRVVGDGMHTFWPWLHRKSWTIMKNHKKIQKHWHFWPWLQRKSWTIMKNNKKWPKMTKTLTFLIMIAARIMKNYEKLQKSTKNYKNIDIFEYDCSENHEIMVVLMDLEAETLSESRYFYARPAQISFKSWFY